MSVVDQDIDLAQDLAREMLADEAFREMLDKAESDEHRAAYVAFYVLQRMRAESAT